VREVFTVHEPLLVNTLGHSAGTLIFATFLYLLLKDRAGARLRGSRLTLAAAALALLWNVASLMVLAIPSDALVTLSSSALSLLPAVLLHLSMGEKYRAIRWAGYVLSAATILIHATEPWFNAFEHHILALRLTTFGFGALTLVAVILLLRSTRTLSRRLAGTMSLLLFSLSFVHFGVQTAHASWPVELFAHHAGIALALFVLLQDYRFLLLDAFIRFLANVLLAAGFVVTVVAVLDIRTVLTQAASDPFREGILIVLSCLGLLLFAVMRSLLDRVLQHLVFPRRNLDLLLQDLRSLGSAHRDEHAFLQAAAKQIGDFLDASAVEFDGPVMPPALPAPVSDLPPEDRARLEAAGVEAVLPIRLSSSETRTLFLGRRRGGRRYLSDDFAALGRIQAELTDQFKAFREAAMRQLVSQAELRALQSQIHPHFLFNALNTLYGVIPREALGARRTVLNLADIFRYFLRTDRAFLPLEEELHIVKAYLEIESMRLGSRLRAEIDVAPDTLGVLIPVLTIEPLVENAVKHGIASRTEGGTVRLEARLDQETLRVMVSDTGKGFVPGQTGGERVGLENVVKRLQLSYGEEAGLHIETGPEGTSVEFHVPARRTLAVKAPAGQEVLG
jgi:two-component system LytT family sensor kinase